MENAKALEQYKAKGKVAPIKSRPTMPTVREVVVVEIREAREWLGLDAPVEAKVNRFSRVL